LLVQVVLEQVLPQHLEVTELFQLLILQVLLVAVVEQDQVLSVMLAVQVVAVVELIHVIQVLLVEQVHHVKVMLEELGLTQAQVELLQMQEGLVVAAVLVL
tara:strand:- start:304 stop:606 length:303 start_codon:yes stop_codon:yes gene_type:complete